MRRRRYPPGVPSVLAAAEVLYGFIGLAVGALVVYALNVVRARRSENAEHEAALKRLGPYTLDKKIGEGGMGEVFLGRHALLSRPAAIKTLRAELADADAITSFEQEVQLTGQLRHPSTVAVYDYGTTPEGRFYYAMEYLSGQSLDRIVKATGPFDEGRTIHVLRQLCGSLSEAHAVRLIHRDIKPANLILCVRGGVYDWLKVVDFGLVKDVGSDLVEQGVEAGYLSGTPLYMAPEGMIPKYRHDGRQDLYAVGAVAYFLLTGDHVFRGETEIEILRQHIKDEPEALSNRAGRSIEPTLEKVIYECLSKKPDERPPTAGALSHRLEECPDAGAWTPAAAQLWWIQNEGKLGIPEPLPHTETASTFFGRP